MAGINDEPSKPPKNQSSNHSRIACMLSLNGVCEENSLSTERRCPLTTTNCKTTSKKIPPYARKETSYPQTCGKTREG